MTEEEKLEEYDQMWKDLYDYQNGIIDHNDKLIDELVVKYGGDFRNDYLELLDFVDVTGKIEIIDKVKMKHTNDDPCGIFTKVTIDQHSVGLEGDSYEGYIYGMFDKNKWLKIPYSC